uniref:Uncharacterized protein n=1 Tax=Arundo donax TaxID=35708 RepID=A0A0A8Y2G8_ARUDO
MWCSTAVGKPVNSTIVLILFIRKSAIRVPMVPY